MLNLLLAHHPLVLGLVQAGLVSLLALGVMLMARSRSIHLERETIEALVRGFVQIILIGLVLASIIDPHRWQGRQAHWALALGVLLLGIMITVAARMAGRRIKGLPGAGAAAFYGIALGVAPVILVMTLIGVIAPSTSAFVPVGSMIISNSMNTCVQALERFRADVVSHAGAIETALALGASPEQAAAPYVQQAVAASMIPAINSLRSLGIVWIPGLMAGMVLSGSSPLYAAIYQFVVIAMIFAVASLTAVIATLVIRARIFSSAEQLLLRPGIESR